MILQEPELPAAVQERLLVAKRARGAGVPLSGDGRVSPASIPRTGEMEPHTASAHHPG